MNLPFNKNKSWIAALHESIEQLDEQQKAAIMKPAGKSCSEDLLQLCAKYLGNEVGSLEDLVSGWNTIRDKRGLTGKWLYEGNTLKGVFKECGCPLVRSGLIELHPVQCYCSQGMMEAVFSQVCKTPVEVVIKGTIARGDDACHFVVKF